MSEAKKRANVKYANSTKGKETKRKIRQNPENKIKAKAATKEWLKTPKGKEHARKKSQKWRQRHPETYNEELRRYNITHPKEKYARTAANRIPLEPECELCPKDDRRTEDLERHHPDYDYPLIFITTCKECHELQDAPGECVG